MQKTWNIYQQMFIVNLIISNLQEVVFDVERCENFLIAHKTSLGIEPFHETLLDYVIQLLKHFSSNNFENKRKNLIYQGFSIFTFSNWENQMHNKYLIYKYIE